jgi:hypothetical protein
MYFSYLVTAYSVKFGLSVRLQLSSSISFNGFSSNFAWEVYSDSCVVDLILFPGKTILTNYFFNTSIPEALEELTNYVSW